MLSPEECLGELGTRPVPFGFATLSLSKPTELHSFLALHKNAGCLWPRRNAVFRRIAFIFSRNAGGLLDERTSSIKAETGLHHHILRPLDNLLV